MFTLMTGTAVSQVVSFAASPVLTRLYRPDEFGLFALFVSIASLISVLAAGRYEFAIVLPEKERDALNVLALSVILVLIVSVACLVLVGFYGYFAAADDIHREQTGWVYYLPCFVFFTGLYQCLLFWNNRRKNFQYSSISRITLSVGTALASIFLGYYGMGYFGLVYGAIIGQASATALLGWLFFRDESGNLGTIGSARIREVAARYSNFPKINVLHALIDTMSSSGSVFIITYYFGAAIVGYYSFMMRIIQAPANLVSSSISQVFYQKASETFTGGKDLAGLIRELTRRLAALGILPALVLLATGPWIFRVVFGSRWETAGVYARLLTPYIFMYFVAAPLAFIPFVVNRQKQSLVVSTLGNAIFFSSIIIGATVFHDIQISLLIFSVLAASYFIYYRRWVISIAMPGIR